MGYSPWGLSESDMTERLHFHFAVASSTVNLSSVTYVSGFVMIVCQVLLLKKMNPIIKYFSYHLLR